MQICKCAAWSKKARRDHHMSRHSAVDTRVCVWSIYIHIYIRVYMYVCTYVYIYVCVCVYIYMFTNGHIYKYIYIYTSCTYTYIHTYENTYICMNMYVYIYMYTCKCVYFHDLMDRGLWCLVVAWNMHATCMQHACNKRDTLSETTEALRTVVTFVT